MNSVISDWIANVKTYPPAEIFYDKYGKAAKAEERIKVLCEDLYKFCFPENEKNHLNELFSSYRDFEVAYKMGFDSINPEYIIKVKDKFLDEVKSTIKVLDSFFKKDQILQEYYMNWKVKFNDINSAVYDMTKGYV